MGRYPNIAPRLERNNLAWTGNGVNPLLQNLTITPWDPNFDGGFVCGADSQVSSNFFSPTVSVPTRLPTHPQYAPTDAPLNTLVY